MLYKPAGKPLAGFSLLPSVSIRAVLMPGPVKIYAQNCLQAPAE